MASIKRVGIKQDWQPARGVQVDPRGPADGEYNGELCRYLYCRISNVPTSQLLDGLT